MADNSSQGGSDTIRDKDRAGVKTQIVGLDVGIGTGTEALMSDTNPLPVKGGWPTAVTASWSNATSANTRAQISTNGMATVVVVITGSSLNGGLISFQKSNDNGTTWCAATAIRESVAADFPGAGPAASFVYQSISGTTIASATWMFLVDVAAFDKFAVILTSTITSGTAALTITATAIPGLVRALMYWDESGSQVLQVRHGAGALGIGKAEDGASSDGDVGAAVLAVRKATPADTSGSDGDYEFLQIKDGRLYTRANLEIGGTAVDGNSGNKSAQTVRVVLATDQPQLTNALKVDGSAVTQPVSAAVGAPVFVTPTPSTTGGWTKWNNSNAALKATKAQVKGSAGVLGPMIITNEDTTVNFVQIFDAASASVTVGTTVPDWTLEIPPLSAMVIPADCGMNMANGITVAATTTRGGNTANTNGVTINVAYK